MKPKVWVSFFLEILLKFFKVMYHNLKSVILISQFITTKLFVLTLQINKQPVLWLSWRWSLITPLWMKCLCNRLLLYRAMPIAYEGAYQSAGQRLSSAIDNGSFMTVVFIKMPLQGGYNNCCIYCAVSGYLTDYWSRAADTYHEREAVEKGQLIPQPKREKAGGWKCDSVSETRFCYCNWAGAFFICMP